MTSASKITIDLDSEPGPHWLTKDRKDKDKNRLAEIRRKKQKERRLVRRGSVIGGG